jgi:hypothetical protein
LTLPYKVLYLVIARQPTREAAVSNRSAAVIVVAAVVLGILGDALLRATPWGINFFLWVSAGVAVVAVLYRRRRGAEPTELALLFAPPVLFAFAVTWHDAETLTVWNVLAVALTLSLPLTRLFDIDLRLGRVADYVAGLITTGLAVILGPIMFAADDVEWSALAQPGKGRVAFTVAVGIVLAVPVALVFGGLLMAADPGFERLVRALFDWDFETIATHVMLSAFLAWLALGYLRAVVHGGSPTLTVPEPRSKPALGLMELGIPLGILTVLFVAFLVLQAEYLFGGEELIRRTTGVTFAEHARRGFFELVGVSVLLLPLLLASEWVLDKRDPRVVKGFRALAGALVVLIGLIMASAVHRMSLYLEAYGLSEDRIYASAVLLWAAVAIGWFAATVLRGRAERFAFGAMVSGFAVLALLNFTNPDALVVRVNVARAEAGLELDADYLSGLSADAVPSLAAAIPVLPDEVRCYVRHRLVQTRHWDQATGWRSWNVARWRARRASDGLRATAADPECPAAPDQAAEEAAGEAAEEPADEVAGDR